MRSCSSFAIACMSSRAVGTACANSLTSLRTSSIRAAGMKGDTNSQRRIRGRGSWNRGNLPDSFRAREEFGMDREGQRVETLHERRGGSVKKFVANAEDTARARGGGPLPAPIHNDFIQRDPVT